MQANRRCPFPVSLLLLGATLALSACGNFSTTQPSPVRSADPSPSPSNPASASPSYAPSAVATPSPSPTPHVYQEDFEKLALGSQPADFVDVSTETTVPSWVYQGNWKVAVDQDKPGNHVFLHDDVRTQPNVSFQRYRGTAMGQPNGQMPDKYYAEVDMRLIDSPNNYPPTGDQGVQFYFLRYDTYVEVVIKPEYIEIWEANQAEPKTTKGWKRLWGEPLTTHAHNLRHIGALVDKTTGNFTAYLDGQPIQTVHSDIIQSQPSYMALRAIGNIVSFDNLHIEERQ